MDPLSQPSSNTTAEELKQKEESLVDSLGHQPGAHRSHSKLFWSLAGILIILALLAILFMYTMKQFSSNVTDNHAEHGRQSPSVHQIVHVNQVLKVGVSSDLPPMSFESNGTISGYEIDLARAIAGELNVPVEFVHYDFRDATSGAQLDRNNPLDKNEVDVIISSLITTPSREQLYSFSDAYLELGQVIVSKSSNTAISGLSDVVNKRIAAEEGSTGQELLNTFGQAGEVVLFDTLSEGVDLLKNNEVEAIVIDAPHAQSVVASNPVLHIATDLLTREEYGIAIRRDEDDLSGEINSILERLRQKGVTESLRQKWLN